MKDWRWLLAPGMAWCMVILVYLLYRRGVVVTRHIMAWVFVFRPGRDGDRATLKSCTGWVRHVGRFYESGTYRFVFDAQLSKGDAEVLLLDRQKREILRLSCQSPAGRAELEGKERYFLHWEFRRTTGSCELRWTNED